MAPIISDNKAPAVINGPKFACKKADLHAFLLDNRCSFDNVQKKNIER